MDDGKPWSRQEGEPDLWFHRFQGFLRLGGTRSISRAYAIEWSEKNRKSPDAAPTSPPAGWKKNAKKWRWSQRAAAWDDAQFERELEDAENIRAMRRREVIDREWRHANMFSVTAERIFDEVAQMESLAKVRTTEDVPVEGEGGYDIVTVKKVTTEIDPNSLLTTAARLAEQASSLSRRVLGLPSTVRPAEPDDGPATQDPDISIAYEIDPDAMRALDALEVVD